MYTTHAVNIITLGGYNTPMHPVGYYLPSARLPHLNNALGRVILHAVGALPLSTHLLLYFKQ